MWDDEEIIQCFFCDNFYNPCYDDYCAECGHSMEEYEEDEF